MRSKLINVADLPSDVPGKTWRQRNSEIQHQIPLDSLVEVLPYGDTPETDYGEHTGCRLFVVGHSRDCDQTPLYNLSFNKVAKVEEDLRLGRNCVIECDGMRLRGDLWINGNTMGGFAEHTLKVIRLPDGSTPGEPVSSLADQIERARKRLEALTKRERDHLRLQGGG